MPSVTIPLANVTPLFLNGATGKNVELRTASVIGELRWWLRAKLGITHDLAQVYEIEQKIMGSTTASSPVSLLLTGQDDIRYDVDTSCALLPHRIGTDKPPSYTNALIPKREIDLLIRSRPGIAIPTDFWDALSLWVMLGGVGKRSRRMFGGLQIVNDIEGSSDTGIQNYPWLNASARSCDDLINDLRQLFTTIPMPKAATLPNVPTFPTLHPDHSIVLVGKKGFDESVTANKALFTILHEPRFIPHHIFGYASKSGRLASPVIAQVRTFSDNKYYPVFTIMRYDILGILRTDWKKVMNPFIARLHEEFKTEQVWGPKGGMFS